jgi:putative FmdB family regulatory protein
MPIYEYKCEQGHVFDAMQKMADDPLTSCIECGASVRKLMQPVGISFKGSGFYSTDYSSGKASSSAGSSGSSESSGNGDSSSSDSSGGSAGGSSEKSSGDSSKTSSNSGGASKGE